MQVTWGIIYEQNPERARHLDRRQADAVYEILRWRHNVQKQIAARTRCPGQESLTQHCLRCQFGAEHRIGLRCTKNPADCPCAPFHQETREPGSSDKPDTGAL
jgi:hypothetical protein